MSPATEGGTGEIGALPVPHFISDRLRSDLEYRAILRTTQDGFWINDGSARFLDVNDAYCRMTGYERAELLSMSISDIEAVENPEDTRAHIEKVIATGFDRFETRHRRKDGAVIDVEVTVTFLPVGGGRFVVFVRDITEMKRARARLDLYANVFRLSGEAIMITDPENRIVAVNDAFTQLTGYGIGEILGRDPNVLASGKTPRETYDAMWEALGTEGFWQGEIWDRRKDGAIYPKWVAITVVRDDRGAIANYIASFTDVSERKAAEEEIRRLAHRDPLTGLVNRTSLQHRLDQALLAARRERRVLAVLFVDMDNFKGINDTLGHPVGDGLLIEVARRLLGLVRESDIVARVGGDEFVIVLTGMETENSAARVAKGIIRELGRPYAVDGHELQSSPSIGISVYPADGEDGAVLMRHADVAMYHAKASGRNNFQFFTVEMNAVVARRMQTERDLRRALEEGRLQLYYQPKIDAASGNPCGVEALLRWNHPVEGVVTPDRFISIAEENGLIIPIGEWVLNESCRQLAEWRKRGLPGIRMAVNISAKQLHSAKLLEQVRTALTRHDLHPGELELEITESTAMADPERAIALLHALRDLGVTLTIDDFGTGYSSLAYLKRLPIHTLKLDRSFVKDIETSEDDAAICAATIALAHTLGIQVVAEGVETERQRSFLVNRHGCDVLQGYLFSRPVPAAQAEQWIEGVLFGDGPALG